MSIARTTRLYALSHFGKALLWVAADTFTLFYLTDVCRFPTASIGWFFLLLLCWSALCDVGAGLLCDRLSLSAERIQTLIRLSAIIATIGFAATFAVPSSRPLGWIWLGASSITYRTAYSFLDVPHNSLLSRLVEGGAGAMWLSSARLGLNMIATLMVTAAAPWLIVKQLALSREVFMFSAAALALFAGFAVVFGTPRLSIKARQRDSSVAHRTLPIAVMFAVAIISALLVSLLFKSVFYFADYTLAHPEWAPRALMFATSGKLVGAVLWGNLARHRVGTTNTIRYACLATLVTASALPAVLGHVAFMEIGVFALGLSLSGTVVAPWAALADRTAGGRTTGAAWFGFFTALSKIGIGISGWCIALLLAHLDIVPGSATNASQGQALFVTCAAILAAGAALCLGLLSVSISRAT